MRPIRNYIMDKLWKPLNIHEVCWAKGKIKTIRFNRKNKEQVVLQFGRISKFGFNFIYKKYEFIIFRIGLRY